MRREAKAGIPKAPNKPVRRRALVTVEELSCAWCGTPVPVRVIFKSGAELRRHKSRIGYALCGKPACSMALYRARKRAQKS